MEKLTTVALQVLMYWLLVQPSSQASQQSATAKSSQGLRSHLVKNKTGINFCNLLTKNQPLFCNCKPSDMDKAIEMSCGVMNLPKVDDPIWEDIAIAHPKLEKLELAPFGSTNMTNVPTKALRLFRNLTHITLKDATLEELVEKAFSDIPSLIEINATRCSIAQLKKYAFGNMTKLNAIYLNDNYIHEINRDIFVALPSLKKLVINRNNLRLIHDRALKHLTTLETLELSENQISVITSETFSGLKSLKHLNLRNNVIEMIGDKTFNQVPELLELYLDHNKIQFMANGALEGLRNLRKLGLSHNNLVKLERNIFSSTSSLNFLDLRSNKLKSITFEHVKGMLQDLYNGTSHLYLEDNNFICDCNLAWISGARNETKNKNLRDYLSTLTCFLESPNASIDKYEVGNNETGIEVKHNSDESYEVRKVKEPSQNKEGEVDNYDVSLTSKIETGKLQKIDGKLGYIKHISDLIPNVDYPCPEQGRLGSEQSSSHLGNDLTSSASKTKLFLSSCVQIVVTIFTLAVL